VLYYEDFEDDKPNLEKGKLETELAGSSGKGTWQLSGDSKQVASTVNLSKSKVTMPAGLPVNQLVISFMLWSDQEGEVLVKGYHSKGDYYDGQRVSKEKTWVPVKFKLTEVRNTSRTSASRVESEHIWTKFEIIFKPKEPKKPTVHIDDVLITVGLQPMEVLPALISKKFAAADPDKSGGTLKEFDLLKATLKASERKGKPKSVLVFGTKSNKSDELTKAVEAIAAKEKCDLSFAAAAAPDQPKLGGIEDARLLLPYNVLQSQAEQVILVLTRENALAAGRSSAGVIAVVQRALAMGCVPIVCLPATHAAMTKGELGKIKGYCNSVSATLTDMGVPWVDSTAALKANAAAFDKDELSAVGLASVMDAALDSAKQVNTSVFGRK